MRSDFQHQMFNLIQNLTGNDNILAVPKEFMKFAGDPSTGIMLSQLVYWTGREKRKDGYIYKTYKEWEEELGIPKYYVRKAKNNLEDRNLIKTKLKKANGSPTIHYKLNQEKFVEEFIEFLEEKRNDGKDNITQKENINNTNGNSKYHNSLTEITTKTNNKDNIGDVEEVWKHYKQAIKGVDYNPRKFSSSRKKAINQLLNDFTLDEIKKAINNATSHKFMMGDNKDNKFHLLPEKLFTFKKIEEYLDYKNNVQQFEEADYYADLK